MTIRNAVSDALKEKAKEDAAVAKTKAAAKEAAAKAKIEASRDRIARVAQDRTEAAAKEVAAKAKAAKFSQDWDDQIAHLTQLGT